MKSIVVTVLLLLVFLVCVRLLFSQGDKGKRTSGKEAQLENFTNNYYRSLAPDKAPKMLKYFTANLSDTNWHTRRLMAFFFGRIGQNNPRVAREYEALFAKSTHEGRQVILQVLAVAADNETRKFLETCLNDDKFKEERDEISRLLEQPFPVKINVLERPIQVGFDLDLLWAEFIVTGDTRAVVRIIDVLEWPDRIRENLQAWMQSNSPSLSETDRRRIEQGLRVAGILYDFSRNEIKNAEDLDSLSLLRDGAMSRDRLEEIKKVLPFALSDEHLNYMSVKAAARWSLTSNAAQHPAVFETCEAEAATRTGRAKVALLEIKNTSRP